MDGVVIIGGIVLFLVVGPWVLVWWANGARKRDREEDQEHSRELASRISILELGWRRNSNLTAMSALQCG
jgi:4-amino-4-deoxy-L-arabinose transferase-like glycosyltransferase